MPKTAATGVQNRGRRAVQAATVCATPPEAPRERPKTRSARSVAAAHSQAIVAGERAHADGNVAKQADAGVRSHHTLLCMCLYSCHKRIQAGFPPNWTSGHFALYVYIKKEFGTGAKEAPSGGRSVGKPAKRRRKKAEDAEAEYGPLPQPILLAAPGVLAKKWVSLLLALCWDKNPITVEQSYTDSVCPIICPSFECLSVCRLARTCLLQAVSEQVGNISLTLFAVTS